MRHQDIVGDMKAALISRGPVVRTAVEADVREALSSASASEVVTFVTEDGTRYEPSATPEYLHALWCFLLNQKCNGQPLDSAVSARAVTAAEAAISRVLSTDDTLAALLRPVHVVGVAGEITAHARGQVQKDIAVFRREIMDLAGGDGAKTVQRQMFALATDQAATFLTSTAGHAVLSAIAKLSASAAGKALIANVVKMSAVKVSSYSVIKVIMAAQVKHIGLVFSIKTVIAGLLGPLVPAIASSKIPVTWIVAPVLIAFIAHEIGQLPKKLAAEVPGRVGESIEQKWPEISEAIIASMLHQAATGDLKSNNRRWLALGIALLLLIFVGACITLFLN